MHGFLKSIYEREASQVTASDNSTPHLSTIYDVQIPNTIPHYDGFHDETINIVRAIMPDPGSWLDTGCGTGTLVRKCLKTFPDTTFILADPSAEMLQEARQKLAGVESKRVDWLEPVATQQIALQVDRHVDIVTAVQSHHYLSAAERRSATEVCYGVLNRGGVFVTFENIRPSTEIGVRIGKQNWSNYQLSRGKSLEEVEKHMQRFDVEYHPITVEEHLDLYRSCGFAAVELFWFSCMQAGFYSIK
jgi:tRNA (cmo5U34)-methyltransferase